MFSLLFKLQNLVLVIVLVSRIGRYFERIVSVGKGSVIFNWKKMFFSIGGIFVFVSLSLVVYKSFLVVDCQ